MSGANIAGEERSSNWYPVHAPASYKYNLINNSNNISLKRREINIFILGGGGGVKKNAHGVKKILPMV
jgi:hypothetical protein